MAGRGPVNRGLGGDAEEVAEGGDALISAEVARSAAEYGACTCTDRAEERPEAPPGFGAKTCGGQLGAAFRYLRSHVDTCGITVLDNRGDATVHVDATADSAQGPATCPRYTVRKPAHPAHHWCLGLGAEVCLIAHDARIAVTGDVGHTLQALTDAWRYACRAVTKGLGVCARPRPFGSGHATQVVGTLICGGLGRGAAREVGVAWLLVKAGVVQAGLPGALAEVVAVDSGHEGVLCKGTPSQPAGSGVVAIFYRLPSSRQRTRKTQEKLQICSPATTPPCR